MLHKNATKTEIWLSFEGSPDTMDEREESQPANDDADGINFDELRESSDPVELQEDPNPTSNVINARLDALRKFMIPSDGSCKRVEDQPSTLPVHEERQESNDTLLLVRSIQESFKCFICHENHCAMMLFCTLGCGRFLGCFTCFNEWENCPNCREALPSIGVRKPLFVPDLAAQLNLEQLTRRDLEERNLLPVVQPRNRLSSSCFFIFLPIFVVFLSYFLLFFG